MITTNFHKHTIFTLEVFLLYPDSGISMDEEIVLGVMMWSYNKAELILFVSLFSQHTVQL